MISRDERRHVVALKEWSRESRVALKQLRSDSTVGKLLQRVMPDDKAETVFDNVDWLVALIEREEHRYGVRALTNIVGAKK